MDPFSIAGGLGGMTGGMGGPSSAKAGDIRGGQSGMFGDFIVGSGASKDTPTSTASWLTAAASVVGVGVTLYLAYKAYKK